MTDISSIRVRITQKWWVTPFFHAAVRVRNAVGRVSVRAANRFDEWAADVMAHHGLLIELDP